jgi:hypothetical protein
MIHPGQGPVNLLTALDGCSQASRRTWATAAASARATAPAPADAVAKATAVELAPPEGAGVGAGDWGAGVGDSGGAGTSSLRRRQQNTICQTHHQFNCRCEKAPGVRRRLSVVAHVGQCIHAVNNNRRHTRTCRPPHKAVLHGMTKEVCKVHGIRPP